MTEQDLTDDQILYLNGIKQTTLETIKIKYGEQLTPQQQQAFAKGRAIIHYIVDEPPMTMLEKLHDANVVKFSRTKNGFLATDSCDTFYDLEMTRDDVLQLAQELIALAQEINE
jgi:hypothetical protein